MLHNCNWFWVAKKQLELEYNNSFNISRPPTIPWDPTTPNSKSGGRDPPTPRTDAYGHF